MNKNLGVKKRSLGRTAVFLIPSLKLEQPDNKGRKIKDLIHKFLLAHFSGYTVEVGNIFGYWKDEKNKEEYGEHRRFTVAFEGRGRIPFLERFLAKIGGLINEKRIYLETGEDVWLIYSQKRKTNKIK